LDYLINTIVRLRPLHNCHAFVRDRTRSIRQDFTLQNIRDVTAVQAHEKIARFHILCLHDLTGYDEKQFSEQQETEQLRKGNLLKLQTRLNTIANQSLYSLD
jgi:hypothetical protein